MSQKNLAGCQEKEKERRRLIKQRLSWQALIEIRTYTCCFKNLKHMLESALAAAQQQQQQQGWIEIEIQQEGKQNAGEEMEEKTERKQREPQQLQSS